MNVIFIKMENVLIHHPHPDNKKIKTIFLGFLTSFFNFDILKKRLYGQKSFNSTNKRPL